MANNTELNLGTGGDLIATEDISGVKHELVKLEFGTDGVATKVSSTDPLPVTDDAAETSLASIDSKLTSPLTVQSTDLDIRNLSSGADSITVVGTVSTGLSQPLTDAQLRASAVPVSGTVTVDTSTLATSAKQDTGNTSLSSIDSKLTNPLPISGTVSTGLSQPLTDTQLRATPVPVSGTVTATPTGTQNVDVTANTIGLATSAKQDTGNTSLASIDTKLTNPLPVSAASLPLPSLASTSTKQSDGSQKTQVVDGSGNVIGATSNALDINIKSGNPTTITATQATGTNLHTVVDSGTITTVSTVTAVTAISNALPAGTNNIGDVDVATLPALVAGTALIGKVGIDQTTPGTTNNVTTKDLPDSASTYALTNVSSTALEASHVLKNGAGYLFMLTGYNNRTSEQFIQLHNTTSVPSDTATPVLIFKVSAGSNFSLNLGKYGRYFSTGISICNSSTAATKTVGSADCWFDAQII